MVKKMPHPNKGKKLCISVNGETYARYPIRTKKIVGEGDVEKTINTYVHSYLKKGDIVCVSERIIAVMQGRSYPLSQIQPSLLARTLNRFVMKNPGGIGLRSPWTMELALREAGVLRIIIAAFLSLMTKPLGIRGVFYHVAGNDINAIDGPCEYTLPPGNTHAKLGPKNPKEVARSISSVLGCEVGIIDANDFGVRVLGLSDGLRAKLIEGIFRDNPLGQGSEQTPIAIVRLN